MKKEPYIWAHRGASAYAPENTLPAFELAASMGADGVELDIQMTKDKQLVVCHDPRLERVSNGHGWVKDYTLDQLKALDFSGGKKDFEGVQIPTLAEVYDLLQDTGLTVNVELKKDVPFSGMEKALLELTREKGYEDRVIYSSFNHLSLELIRVMNKQARIGYLLLKTIPNLVDSVQKLKVNALHIPYADLKKTGLLEKCQKAGIALNVWTVNTNDQARGCAELGINAMITDYPDKARQWLAKTTD